MKIVIQSFFIFVIVLLIFTQDVLNLRIRTKSSQVVPGDGQEKEATKNTTEEDTKKIENQNKEEQNVSNETASENKCNGSECTLQSSNENTSKEKNVDTTTTTNNNNNNQPITSSEAKEDMNQKFMDTFKEITISEEGFQSAKNVCENIVSGNNHFGELCNRNDLFEALETVRVKNINLYNNIMNGAYENKEFFNFQLVNTQDNKKVYVEHDMHHPKSSILFLFAKFCIGGIPLACGTITKYKTSEELNSYTDIPDNKEKKSEQKENGGSDTKNT